MAIFQFRSGRSVKGVDAQMAGEELDRLRIEANGLLTAQQVLDAARDAASPLHSAFTWDDNAAAEQHRLNEARKLIVSIRVFSTAAAKSMPAYINVRSPDGRGYKASVDVLSNEDLKARVLIEIQQHIEALERKYASFGEIGEILSRVKNAAMAS